jgi:hypothetical protein
LGQRRELKKPWAEEIENKNALLGCVWVHPQNNLNGLILNSAPVAYPIVITFP